jgi:hypothetical protein
MNYRDPEILLTKFMYFDQELDINIVLEKIQNKDASDSTVVG